MAQFIKKLSNTEAELKKIVAYIKKECVPPFSKFVTEVLIFAEANTFFQLNLVFIVTAAPVFIPGLL